MLFPYGVIVYILQAQVQKQSELYYENNFPFSLQIDVKVVLLSPVKERYSVICPETHILIC